MSGNQADSRSRIFIIGLPLMILAVLFMFSLKVEASDYWTVTGTKNFLAVRSSAEYSDSNIIGKLYNGDQVVITGGWQGDYVWVYAPSLNLNGFVDGKYLSASGGSSVNSFDYRTVTGTKNYLAVRSSAEYSDSNIMGKLYNGDQVIITGGWQGDYVWIYAPSLDLSGFVDGKYLSGASSSGQSSGGSYSDYRTVTGTKNYLAVRSSAEYNDSNIMGKLYNGDQVIITGGWQGDYVWIYAPSLGLSGFVDGKYLSGSGSSGQSSGGSYSDYRTVTGTENYLALRTAPEYSDSNIIGKLYNGDQVVIAGDWQGEYVWVYAPSLDRDGYVNGKYLSGSGSSGGSSGKSSKNSSSKKKTVTGTENYLALRTAPEYSDSNIIGKLYNGDQVEVTGKKSGEYVWVYSSKLDKSGYVNSKYLK